MVKGTDFDQCQSIPDALRNGLIGRAGAVITRWVIMAEDTGGGIVPQGRFNDLTRVNSRVIDTAVPQRPERGACCPATAQQRFHAPDEPAAIGKTPWSGIPRSALHLERNAG